MKLKIAFAIIICSLFATASKAQILNSWKDPSISAQNPVLHKIIVAAAINDPNIRKQVEDYMASLYPGMATQSYIIFGIQPLNKDEAAYNQTLINQGYDGIVMMQQTSSNVSEHYVQGFPGYYHTWGGYWHNGWSYQPPSPGHVANDYHWYVQTNAYAVRENKMVYSVNLEVTDPHGRFNLFRIASDMTRGQMRTDNFLY